MARIHLHDGSILEVNDDGVIDFFSSIVDEKKYEWTIVNTTDGVQILLRLRTIDYIEEEQNDGSKG